MTDTRRDVAERERTRLRQVLAYVAGKTENAAWRDDLHRVADLLRSEGREPDAWVNLLNGEPVAWYHRGKIKGHPEAFAEADAGAARERGLPLRTVAVYFGTPSDSPTPISEPSEHPDVARVLNEHRWELASDSPEREDGTSEGVRALRHELARIEATGNYLNPKNGDGHHNYRGYAAGLRYALDVVGAGTSDLREAFLAGWLARYPDYTGSAEAAERAFGEWLAARGTE